MAYAIGVTKPLSLYVDTHGTILNGVTEARLEEVLPTLFDLSPRGIRQHLNLNRPIYVPTSAYGHFGRQPTDEGHFTWEKTDLVEALKKAI